MHIKPVKHLPAPGYPDKYSEESRQALAAAIPRRWIAAPLAAGLAATVALGLSGCERATLGEPAQTPIEPETVEYLTMGEVATVLIPESYTAETTEYLTMGTMPAPTVPRTNPVPANVVVPLFEYGSGTGSIGCVSIAAPVFLSEEEAFAILSAAFAEAGLTLGRGAQPIKKANLPVTNIYFSFGEDPDKMKTKRGTLEPDGLVAGLRVEFVSTQDIEVWHADTGMMSSVSVYPLKQTAKILAENNPGLVVFYDPVTYWDIAKMGGSTGEFRYLPTEKEARAESEQLLRQQAEAFLRWMAGQEG